MNWREHWVRCSCFSAEHSLLLGFDPDDADDWLYVMPHLESRSLWTRVKYLFGHRTRCGGAFTEMVLTDEHVAALEEFLFAFRNRAQGIEAQRAETPKSGSVRSTKARSRRDAPQGSSPPSERGSGD
jgi:hypothetical protein